MSFEARAEDRAHRRSISDKARDSGDETAWGGEPNLGGGPARGSYWGLEAFETCEPTALARDATQQRVSQTNRKHLDPRPPLSSNLSVPWWMGHSLGGTWGWLVAPQPGIRRKVR